MARVIQVLIAMLRLRQAEVSVHPYKMWIIMP